MDIAAAGTILSPSPWMPFTLLGLLHEARLPTSSNLRGEMLATGRYTPGPILPMVRISSTLLIGVSTEMQHLSQEA